MFNSGNFPNRRWFPEVEECSRTVMYSLRSRGAASLSVPSDNPIGGRKRAVSSQKGGGVGPKNMAKKKVAVKVEYEQNALDLNGDVVVAEDLSHGKPVGGSACWEPPRWREQLQNVRTIRAARDAPVDTVGCSRLADRTNLPEVYRFQVLVALMLSSQTKDHVTAQAMTKLRTHGLTVEKVCDTPMKRVEEMIYPVGFWKRKASFIKDTAKILARDYNSDIPGSIDELVKLPGVGPKMAHLCMDVAWGEVTGIGVDTHVHRISNRLGWTRKKTQDPEQTRKALEEWMPRDLWSETNWLLVGFGQQHCLPVSPKCSDCLNKDICPASTAKQRGRK